MELHSFQIRWAFFSTVKGSSCEKNCKMLVSYHLNKQCLQQQVKFRILEVNNLILATENHVPLNSCDYSLPLESLLSQGYWPFMTKKKREKAEIHSVVHSRTGSNNKWMRESFLESVVFLIHYTITAILKTLSGNEIMHYGVFLYASLYVLHFHLPWSSLQTSFVGGVISHTPEIL